MRRVNIYFLNFGKIESVDDIFAVVFVLSPIMNWVLLYKLVSHMYAPYLYIDFVGALHI